MASATALPSVGIAKLYLQDAEPISTSPPPATTVEDSSVAYWAALIQKNLSTAHSVGFADSDDEDTSPLRVDEEIMNAPRRKGPREVLARNIAMRLYPASLGSLAPIIQYEKDIIMLRHLVRDQRRSAIATASERNARANRIKRIARQGPWDEEKDPLSYKGVSSLPMPVEQSEPGSLAPFFAHLAVDGTHEPTSTAGPEDAQASFSLGTEPYYHTELIEFEKGVLYSDGRVDLCKMVTGPRNIGALMESLKTNTFSKHFLLGNNIVGPVGAKAIADFIRVFPDKFETWYLAGNCIDGASFSSLVDAMVQSPAITNVWLKRNPLGPGAAKDVFRLISETPNLRTLDLDQTELGDDGVAELFAMLADHAAKKTLPLRNIYLNGTGIGMKACIQVARFLGSAHCQLESLYMSNNPVGGSIVALTAGLEKNRSLKRLSAQSCGLKDAGVVALASSLSAHEGLAVLDLGQGYATEDLGMRYNWITDVSVPALVDLIGKVQLQYLNLAYTALTQTGLNDLLAAVSTSPALLWFHAKASSVGAKDAVGVKAGQEGARLYKLARERLHENVQRVFGVDYVRFAAEEKRFLVSPRDVRFIDSVYRNRDAGAARRGLKRLEKWWVDGDETLTKVAEGSLG